MKIEKLTIRYAQQNQPWTVPYSGGIEKARKLVPHILLTHAVLHAQKSLGKIASVLEALDHKDRNATPEEESIVQDMAADLMTVALRIANLCKFDLAHSLVLRVGEKNGVNLLEVDHE